MGYGLDYARPGGGPPRSEVRGCVPGAVATLSGLAVATWWLFFFTLGSVAAVDTHFTNEPHKFAEFRLSPWRPPTPSMPWPWQKPPRATTLTREATMPLTLRRLRYVQLTDDGGATVQTVAYYADVRWWPTAAALVASVGVPCVAYYGLQRLLR